MFNFLKSHVAFLVLLFITWKAWVFAFLFFGVAITPLQFHFLGGGVEHYVVSPWFWGWGNFDGEHYLSIAHNGYGNGEQAFFPLYPLLMKVLIWPWKEDIYFLQAAGVVISNLSFLIGIFGLWKLIRLDFRENITKLATILLLVFPTSFYFGSVYTEGLFFALTVWSFYFARRGQWELAGVLGALSAATRFTGIILFLVLLIEWLTKEKKINLKFLPLFLIPVGLLTYMYYLQQTTGDPLAFLHTLTWFGEQRSSSPILLPQVFWRYLKMLVDIPKNDVLFFAVSMEFVVALWFLILSFIGFVKLRISYALWLFLGYLVPTLSGSFSSLPRYVLPLFPAFILMSIFLDKQSMLVKVGFLTIFFVVLGVATALFTSGYWVA